MKVFVKNLYGKDGFEYSVIGEKGEVVKEKRYTDFISGLKSRVNSGDSIYTLEFLGERVLKIEYVKFYSRELDSVVFCFGEDVPLDGVFFAALHDAVREFSKVKDETRERIDKNFSEIRNRYDMITSCKTILKKYLLAGFIIDDQIGIEAARVFSTMISKDHLILSDLDLPMPIASRVKLFALKLMKPIYKLRYCMCDYNAKVQNIEWGWRRYVWNSFLRDYNQKHDFFLEKVEERESLPERKIEDPFIRFILADIEYIDFLSSNSYKAELDSLESLSNRYLKAKREEILGGKPLCGDKFLNELTDLELAIFSKNNKSGLKRSNKGLIRTELIEERLRYIGITESTSTDDKYLDFVFEQIKRITAYPYEGCEKDLVELYRIAADYVKAMNSDEICLTMDSPRGTLLKRETALELEITRKIKACERDEALARDIELIEDSIALARTKMGIFSRDKEKSLINTLKKP